jgi:hypothetical protein
MHSSSYDGASVAVVVVEAVGGEGASCVVLHRVVHERTTK